MAGLGDPLDRPPDWGYLAFLCIVAGCAILAATFL
jgi:hypothetical protein